MKYNISVLATAVIDLGDVEADSQKEAIHKAFDRQGIDTIELCYHCSQRVGELTL
mgnify:CR=1 FL=1|nr:MAG TPA: hypothetical protein [Caudoviricetes sp.]